MKIVLLTTETTHHTYYAWKLNAQFPLAAIVLETRRWVAPFETSHPFEVLRDTYEREVLLADCKSTFTDIADTRVLETVNSDEGVASLRALAPDVIIIFGTGRVSAQLIALPTTACLNLHGGNPEHYRGLDTHLWAIYHRDFLNLVTTLHRVDAELDTGDIVFQSQLQIDKHSRLHHLRAINTEACLQMSLVALSALESRGQLPSRKQLTAGRYYSGMPAVLKEDCLKKFERHVMRL